MEWEVVILELMKVSQVAIFFGVSRNAVYKWIAEKKITVCRTPGGEVRIRKDVVESFTKERG